eukprot:9584086-Lingulodinium_polyedra.AAC.1
MCSCPISSRVAAVPRAQCRDKRGSRNVRDGSAVAECTTLRVRITTHLHGYICGTCDSVEQYCVGTRDLPVENCTSV